MNEDRNRIPASHRRSKSKVVMLKLFSGVFILFILFLSSSCCNNKPPEPVAAVKIKFEGLKDSYQSRAWVIETAKGDSSTKIDSVYYGLMHHVVGYSFLLEFRKDEPNGDYYIYADSVRGPNVITEFVLNTDQDKCGNDVITFTYRFNGIFETQKVREITIHK